MNADIPQQQPADTPDEPDAEQLEGAEPDQLDDRPPLLDRVREANRFSRSYGDLK